MRRYLSNSVKETEIIAEQLGRNAKPGDVFALFGGLGMGKTAFTRGFAVGLGCRDDVSSPTFALVHEYSGGRLPLFHFDMYRVGTFDDLYSTGFFEYLEKNGVLIIEWSENIEAALPENAVKIRFQSKDGEHQRIIEIID